MYNLDHLGEQTWGTDTPTTTTGKQFSREAAREDFADGGKIETAESSTEDAVDDSSTPGKLLAV